VELKRRSYGKADRVEGELENERRKLESKKKERSFLIVLDEKGKELTTGELAAMISDLQKRRYTEIRFFIGGPYGMAPGARAGSDLLLSMSRLTLPHQLARVMLMEQIYRCGTILSGENYHK
jgi:23S rRNA (pseudouridine1915-N3)-methyltransferase